MFYNYQPMDYRKHIRYQNKGFTLLEVMLVVFIISLISASVIGYAKIVDYHRSIILINEANEVAQALAQYYSTHGTYPQDLTAFLSDSSYFRVSLKDPYTDAPLSSLLGTRLIINTSNRTVVVKDLSNTSLAVVSFSVYQWNQIQYNIDGKVYGGADYGQ